MSSLLWYKSSNTEKRQRKDDVSPVFAVVQSQNFQNFT